MFQKETDNVVIAITKSRMVESTYDQDDILDIAEGKAGQQRNFKGFKLMLVE